MNRKRKIIAGFLLLAIVAAVTIYFWPRRKPPASDILEVPLGVEEAMIIAFAGPKLEPVPYAWGVGVNVRIAHVREVAGSRVYDVRYIVNRAGDFDLKNYFRLSDGKPADAIPSFKVRGLERLSKDIEARIAETEDTAVSLHAWYYETLTALGVLWIGWLLLLIFWRRPHPVITAAPVAGPTLADQIRRQLEQLESGTLDAAQQAKLELMIFRQWRHLRSMDEHPMAESLAAFRADPEVAEAYVELETWMHHPKRNVSPAQVARTVRARLESSAPSPADQPQEPVPS